MNFSEKWIEIIDTVSSFYEKRAFVWFRGHSKSDTYELNSGLFRECSKKEDLESYLETENNRYVEFSHLGHLDHGKTGWDVLYVMQHHGVKTRLLDWTQSFSTALFFAKLGWEPSKEDACIWMLSPDILNLKAIEFEGLQTIEDEGNYEDYLDDKKPEKFRENSIAIYPIKNNKRIIAQQGVFTLQGNSLLPLDKEFNGALVSEGALIKLVLTEDLYTDVEMFLTLAGVNHYTMFPDMDGLAQFVNIPIWKRSHSSNSLWT